MIATALLAADRAQAVTSRYFRAQLEIDTKEDDSPVTVADRETEAAVRGVIEARHPGHSFLGEESGDRTTGSPWRWVIDPIDGTKSFASGKPTFGTLIALLHGDKPVLGVIDHPALGERWVGVAGRETTFNGEPCRTSGTTGLAASVLYATTPDMFEGEARERFDALSERCRFRVFGADCYAYGLLASGFVELVAEAQLQPYDYLALAPVVEGAGGVITDWSGNPLDLRSGDRVLAAANPALHAGALAILRRESSPGA